MILIDFIVLSDIIMTLKQMEKDIIEMKQAIGV